MRRRRTATIPKVVSASAWTKKEAQAAVQASQKKGKTPFVVGRGTYCEGTNPQEKKAPYEVLMTYLFSVGVPFALHLPLEKISNENLQWV